MKNTLFGRMAKLQGRIRKCVTKTRRLAGMSERSNKKSRDGRRFILTMIAVWTIVPALSVNAADNTVVPVEPIVANVTIGPTLQIEQPKYSVEVRQSPRQLAKKQEEKVRLAAVTAVQPKIGATDTEKRDWVQKAAAAWNIDWKILEAVWQVESGKQMSTAVRSYAGAQGPMQFMPGTWRGYAQDGNGDGVKNVNDARDSLFAAAKLLAANGAASGNVDGALLRYNHSLSYVAHVKRIAAAIGG